MGSSLEGSDKGGVVRVRRLFVCGDNTVAGPSCGMSLYLTGSGMEFLGCLAGVSDLAVH